MDDASNLPQDESWGVEKGGGGVLLVHLTVLGKSASEIVRVIRSMC